MQIISLYLIYMLAVVTLGLCAIVGAVLSFALYEVIRWAWERVRLRALAHRHSVFVHLLPHHH